MFRPTESGDYNNLPARSTVNPHCIYTTVKARTDGWMGGLFPMLEQKYGGKVGRERNIHPTTPTSAAALHQHHR